MTCFLPKINYFFGFSVNLDFLSKAFKLHLGKLFYSTFFSKSIFEVQFSVKNSFCKIEKLKYSYFVYFIIFYALLCYCIRGYQEPYCL